MPVSETLSSISSASATSHGTHQAIPPFLSSRGFSPLLITRLLFTFLKHYSVGFLVNFSYSTYVLLVKKLMESRARRRKREAALMADLEQEQDISKQSSVTGGSVSTAPLSPQNRSRESTYLLLQSYLLRFYNGIKNKSWNTPKNQTKLLAFGKTLKRVMKDSHETGSFLGYWTILYHVFLRILHIRGVNRVPKTSLVVSSFLSGFISQFVFVGVSWKISLYCALRAMLGLTRMSKHLSFAAQFGGANYGAYSGSTVVESTSKGTSRLPAFIAPFFETSTLAYVLINLLLGYNFYYHIDYVDSSYKNFISSMACVNRDSVHNVIDTEMKTSPPCHEYHPKSESCMEAFWMRNIRTFKKVLKLYASVHFFGLIMSGSLWRVRPGQNLLRKYANILRSFVPGVLRSTLFLTMQIVICAPTPCIHNAIVHKYYNGKPSRIIMMLPWLIGPLSIAFEMASRRTEVALYSLWRLLIALINRYTNVKSNEDHSPLWERVFSALMFGLATSLWIVVKTRDATFLKRLDNMILSQVFPPHLDLKMY